MINWGGLGIVVPSLDLEDSSVIFDPGLPQ
jgi:hypothetical protein